SVEPPGETMPSPISRDLIICRPMLPAGLPRWFPGVLSSATMLAILACPVRAQCSGDTWLEGPCGEGPRSVQALGGAGVRGFAQFDPDGAGPAPKVLVAVGEFSADAGATQLAATWDGVDWTSLSIPSHGYALAVTVLGSEVIVAGHFTVVDNGV